MSLKRKYVLPFLILATTLFGLGSGAQANASNAPQGYHKEYCSGEGSWSEGIFGSNMKCSQAERVAKGRAIGNCSSQGCTHCEITSSSHVEAWTPKGWEVIAFEPTCSAAEATSEGYRFVKD